MQLLLKFADSFTAGGKSAACILIKHFFMRYITLLSFAAIIIAAAGIGTQLYNSSKSQMPSDIYKYLQKTTTANDSIKKNSPEVLADYSKYEKEENPVTSVLLWAKIIFSGIFCMASLFVVLSNKYNDETKKWAFSVLTLIAGVWIGTVS